MKLATFVLAVGVGWASGSAGAGEGPDGVFAGTVGKASVVACFSPGAPATYYYAKLGKDIGLVRRRDGTWVETRGDAAEAEEEEAAGGSAGGQGSADGPGSTGTWRLTAGRADRLIGAWTSPDGRRSLPISMTRTARTVSGECPTEAYNGVRMARVVRVPGKEQATAGLRTRAFTALGKSVKGFELLGDAPESKELQRAIEALHRALIGQYYECVGSAATGDREADFSGALGLDVVTEHFVVVKQHVEYDCGGPYPDDDSDHIVFDRATGKKVDIARWLTVPIASIAHKYWKSTEPECAGDSADGNAIRVWPTARGLALEPQFPHAMAICRTDVTVPYARLTGKLTEAGKSAMAEFVSAAR